MQSNIANERYAAQIALLWLPLSAMLLAACATGPGSQPHLPQPPMAQGGATPTRLEGAEVRAQVDSTPVPGPSPDLRRIFRGIASPTAPLSPDHEAVEVDVFTLVLNERVSPASMGQRLFDTSRPYPMDDDRQPYLLKSMKQSTWDDYRQRNRSRIQLTGLGLELPQNIMFVDARYVESLWQRMRTTGTAVTDGWPLYVSRPGLSSDRKQALIHVEDSVAGMLYLLQRSGGSWAVIEWVFTWIS